MIFEVTCDMEPGARIDQSGVPVPQRIGGVKEPAFQSIQSTSWKHNQFYKRKKNDFNAEGKSERSEIQI